MQIRHAQMSNLTVRLRSKQRPTRRQKVPAGRVWRAAWLLTRSFSGCWRRKEKSVPLSMDLLRTLQT